MQDVFIAHDRADIGIAEAYARTLKKLGYEASWDAGGVVNEDWADRALATVKTARCVIALWSPRSVNSEYVNFWATSAAALGKLISVNARRLGLFHRHARRGAIPGGAETRHQESAEARPLAPQRAGRARGEASAGGEARPSAGTNHGARDIARARGDFGRDGAAGDGGSAATDRDA
jgi:hypothetical protein